MIKTIQILHKAMAISNKSPFFIFFLLLIMLLMDILGLGMVFGLVTNLLSTGQVITIPYYEIQLDIKTALIIAIIIYFIRFVTSILVNWLLFSYTQNLGDLIRVKIFSSQILKLSNKQTSAEKIRNIQVVSSISNGIVEAYLRIYLDTLVLLGTTFYVIYLTSYIVLLPILVVFLISAFYFILLKKKLNKMGEISNISSKQMIQETSESIRSQREIIIYNLQSKILKSFSSASSQFAKSGIYVSVVNNGFRYFIEFIIFSLFLVSLYYAFSFEINISNLLASSAVVALALIRILPSVVSLQNSFIKLKNATNSLNILDSELKKLSNNINGTASLEATNFKNFERLSLKNIFFRYESSKPILENLHLEIKHGEKILISGDSGSGKSTLLDLITSYRKPTKGEIRFKFNNNFLSMPPLGLIAYVPQTGFIFNASLDDNITLFQNKSETDIESLKQCINCCELQSIKSEKNNHLGEAGDKISGGQKQRVLIARALYFKPKILILDESTSAMDYQLEKRIIKYITNLNDLTLIMISHNSNLKSMFDKEININQFSHYVSNN